VCAYEVGRDRRSVCRHDLCLKSLNDSKGINLIFILAGVMPTEDNSALDGNIPYPKLWPTEYRQAASLIPVRDSVSQLGQNTGYRYKDFVAFLRPSRL
jgi:hypothetical protein